MIPVQIETPVDRQKLFRNPPRVSTPNLPTRLFAVGFSELRCRYTKAFSSVRRIIEEGVYVQTHEIRLHRPPHTDTIHTLIPSPNHPPTATHRHYDIGTVHKITIEALKCSLEASALRFASLNRSNRPSEHWNHGACAHVIAERPANTRKHG